jgi:hypothetical protein
MLGLRSDRGAHSVILSLRSEIAELGGAIRQLQRSGLDIAAAQLLITRMRVGMSNEPNPRKRREVNY